MKLLVPVKRVLDYSVKVAGCLLGPRQIGQERSRPHGSQDEHEPLLRDRRGRIRETEGKEQNRGDHHDDDRPEAVKVG